MERPARTVYKFLVRKNNLSIIVRLLIPVFVSNTQKFIVQNEHGNKKNQQKHVGLYQYY